MPRKYAGIFFWLLVNLATAQDDIYRSDKLKFSMAFGNSVQMAYDQVDRKFKLSPDGSPDYLDNGDLQFSQGKLKRAIDNYHKAFEDLVAKESGKAQERKPIDVFAISKLLDKRSTTAEKLLKKAESATLSRDNWMLLASNMNSLGIYYHYIGNIKVAEKLLTKALQIRGEQAGKTSEYYVSSLHNLAVLRKDQGRYNAAEDMLKYVVRFYEKKRGTTSYQYAIVINNQAMLYAYLGRMDESRRLLDALLQANPAIEFPGHSFDLARIQVNAALLEIEEGNFDEALRLLNVAQEFFQARDATNHPDYQQIGLQLAKLYLKRGNFASLERHIEQVLIGIDKELGTDNLAYMEALEVKSEYLLATKDYPSALSLYEQIAELRDKQLGSLHLDYLRAQNKIAICHWLSGNTDTAFAAFKLVTTSYLDVVDRFFYNMSDEEKNKFWQSLKSELNVFYTFTLENASQVPDLVSHAYNLRLKTKGLLLSTSNKIRNAIYSQGGEVAEKFDSWLELKEELSVYYGLDKQTIASMGIAIDDLQSEANELEKEINRLASGGLQLGRSSVSHGDISANLQANQAAIEIVRVANDYSSSYTGDQYIALILQPDGSPRLVLIGEAKELESKTLTYYKNAIKIKLKDELTYDKLWQPLQAAIANVTEVFVSPDGVYNLVSLNSLRREDEFVIDELQVNMVPNTSVLANANKDRASNSEVVLVGNPTFGNDRISPLPGTAKEIEEVEKIVAVESRVFKEQGATEEVLKAVSKPKVLHIATHGFFLGDVSAENNLGLTRALVLSSPLMRSGLLLSGAGSENPQHELQASDGILTAYEALNINLQNTDLVVLSACETGTGEIVNGEGVYGLSRAFTIAGARHIIMSLWKVDDEATMELMTAFYREWQGGNNLKQAFILAQNQIKEKYQDPYYWASFVLVSN